MSGISKNFLAEAARRTAVFFLILGSMLFIIGIFSSLRYGQIMFGTPQPEPVTIRHTQLIKSDAIDYRNNRSTKLAVLSDKGSSLPIVTEANHFPDELIRFQTQGTHRFAVAEIVLQRVQRHVYFVESMHYQIGGQWRHYQNSNLKQDIQSHYQVVKSQHYGMILLAIFLLSSGLFLQWLNRKPEAKQASQ